MVLSEGRGKTYITDTNLLTNSSYIPGGSVRCICMTVMREASK